MCCHRLISTSTITFALRRVAFVLMSSRGNPPHGELSPFTSQPIEPFFRPPPTVLARQSRPCQWLRERSSTPPACFPARFKARARDLMPRHPPPRHSRRSDHTSLSCRRHHEPLVDFVPLHGVLQSNLHVVQPLPVSLVLRPRTLTVCEYHAALVLKSLAERRRTIQDWARHKRECVPTRAGMQYSTSVPPPLQTKPVDVSAVLFLPEEGASPPYTPAREL